jgi:hypothetical protein
MPEIFFDNQSPALFPDLPPSPGTAQTDGIRATRQAAHWRDGLAKSFAYAAGRARDSAEEARVWQAYEEELASGPDFTRYHGGSEFMDAPKITADRNELARIRFKLVAIANGSWATKEKGKHAGLVQHSTIRIFDALCHLAKKHGRVFPSLEGIAYLAKCGRNTVLSGLKQLEFFGFVTVFRRVKRIKTALGFRTVQDTNAYLIKEPNTWGEKALALFARIVGGSSESNKWEARVSNFMLQGRSGAISPSPRPSGGAWGDIYEKWQAG